MPKYVAVVPKDIFSGGALHYKPQADGYLLYSVGPNGIDDGGRNQMTTPTTTSFRAAMTSPSASCRSGSERRAAGW